MKRREIHNYSSSVAQSGASGRRHFLRTSFAFSASGLLYGCGSSLPENPLSATLPPSLKSAPPVIPSSEPSSFSSRGIGGGGALYSPSINPANTSEFYVACDMTELFHTTDYGVSYSQVHYEQMHGGTQSKVCFTATSGLLYSISNINDVGTPVKSTDNGVTWTVLPGNPDAAESALSIFADFNNPSRVILATYGYMYFSSDGGATFTLFHTTANAGVGTVASGAFFSGSTIFVGSNDGVLLSTNAGSTWATASISGIPTTQVIISFAAAKVGSVTRLFCITALKADFYVGLTGADYWQFAKGIYSCDYGAGNWATKATGFNLAVNFPTIVKMAENDINTVYLAGSNDASFPTVFKSTNAGTSWVNTFLTTNNENITTGWSGQGGDKQWYYGECALGFEVAASDSNRVIISDYGFVHKSSNGGASWAQAYVDVATQNPANAATPAKKTYRSCGIENTSAWQMVWSDASTVFAAYSDITGMRSTDSGTNWAFDYTGNTANTTYRIAKGSNGTLYAATSNVHDIYQSTRLADAQLDAADPNGKLIYSTNKGATWLDLKVFGHPVVWVALDPNNANVAYASVIHYSAGSGVGGVYRTSNLSSLSAATWTLLPTPPSTEKHPHCLEVLNDGKLVATYSGRRNSSGAFTASSGVFIYNPTANTWANVTHAGMKYWTKDVVIDPFDTAQNTWYVNVCSGWGGAPDGLGGLYKTTNRGTSWTKLTGTTIDRALSCTINPNNANELYLTTEGQGLWLSTDIQAATPTFSKVNSYVFRQPERVFFNPYNSSEMWVTSFGNGMKVGNTGTASCTYSLSANSASAVAGASTGSVTINANGSSCGWSAVSNASSWLTVTSGASGTTTGVVGYSVAANSGVARSGTITIGGQIFTVNQTGSTCSYTLSTTSISVPAGASIGTINVTTTAACAWTAVSNNSPELTVTGGASGTGNGTVSYSVTANTGAARSGTLTIGGQTVTINQAASSCTYVLSATSSSVPATATTGTVTVTAAAGCTWTAVSNGAPDLTVTAGATGSGNGTVNYSITANTGVARSKTITIAGQTFTVNQAAASGSSSGVDYYINESAAAVVFTATVANTSGSIVAEGVAGSNCIKLSGSGLTGYAASPQVGFAVAKDISSVQSTDKLRVSIDWTATAALPADAYLAINFNGMWDQVVYTPVIDNVVGFQTFDIDISSIRAKMGNTLNNVYFSAGNGFPAGSVLKVDEIRFTSSAPPSCTYTLNTNSTSISSSAANGTVSVSAGASCAWTAVSNNSSWLTVTSGGSGTANGTVGYSATANTGAARVGTLTIAGKTFTVNQAATVVGGLDFYMNEAAGVLLFSAAAANTTGAIVAQGIGGSNCIKVSGTGLTGYVSTPQMGYAVAKDISNLLSTGKLRISIDWQATNALPADAYLSINFNGMWDQVVYTPVIDNVVGFQTFDIPISSIRSKMGNTVNNIYLGAGNGFPAGSVLKIDEIRFIP